MLKKYLAASWGSVAYLIGTTLRNLLVARMLGPLDFGSWNLGLLLLRYAEWSHLTLLNAFRLDGARNLGRGDMHKVQLLRRLTWTASTAPATMLSLLSLGLSPWFADPGVRKSVLMMGCLLLTHQLYNFARSDAIIRENFDMSAQMQSLLAFVGLVFSLVLAYVLGFWGVVVGQLISYALVLLFYRRDNRILLSPLFSRSLAVEQIKIGLPVGLNGIVFLLYTTMDRTMVVSLLGTEALGQYGLAALLRSGITLIPFAVSEVLYVRTSTQYGKTNSTEPLLDPVLQTNSQLACWGSLIIGLAVVWLPLVVNLILPEYRPGVPAAQILLVGLAFSLPLQASNLLISTGRAREVLLLYCISTLLEALLIRECILRAGLNGVALGAAISNAFLFLILNIWALESLLSWREVFGHILHCLLPIGGMAVGLSLALLPDPPIGSTDWLPLREILLTAGFLLINLPLVWWRLCDGI